MKVGRKFIIVPCLITCICFYYIHIITFYPTELTLNDKEEIPQLELKIIPKGLINIGCVHSVTQTVSFLLCNLSTIKCNIVFKKRKEFPYLPHHKQSQILRKLKKKNITNISNINAIIKSFSFKDWIKLNWNINDINDNKINKYYLFGRATDHYINIITAKLFGYFAFKYDWKYYIHLREPIKRMWSVQQHWSKYEIYPGIKIKKLNMNKTSDELKQKVYNNSIKYLWNTYNNNADLINYINLIKNESISAEKLIKYYYKWYMNTHILSEKANRIFSFEITHSLYCVPIMFWLKYFEKYNVIKNFRIIQSEYISSNLKNSLYLIYCWLINNKKISECINNNLIDLDTNIYIGSEHRWTISMTLKDKMKFMDLFMPCNQRLDQIINENQNILLGEWSSWNEKYKNQINSA